MNTHGSKGTARVLALVCVLAAGCAASAAVRRAGVRAAGCEGAACQQVAVTFDDAKRQYRAHNNSADSWVRVSASSPADSATACLPPGGDGYLALRSIAGNYRAEYSEPRCGAQGGAE